MAVRDYREMYINTILKLGKDSGMNADKITRSYLSNLSFDELKELAEKLQG